MWDWNCRLRHLYLSVSIYVFLCNLWLQIPKIVNVNAESHPFVWAWGLVLVLMVWGILLTSSSSLRRQESTLNPGHTAQSHMVISYSPCSSYSWFVAKQRPKVCGVCFFSFLFPRKTPFLFTLVPWISKRAVTVFSCSSQFLFLSPIWGSLEQWCSQTSMGSYPGWIYKASSN